MEVLKCQDRAASRFEKIVRFYWDGVPIPPFVSDDDVLHRTFTLKQLNYSPDYYGEVRELPLVQEELITHGFLPLCKWEQTSSSISCRIGAHHSPYIGLFKFPAALDQLKVRRKLKAEAEAEDTIIRIPSDPCDLPEDWDDEIRWNYRKFIRTTKLLEMYVPIIKEYCPITLSSLRRIVVLATVGISPHKKEFVVRETLNVKDEYTRWMCSYVFYYMCADPLFSRILAPLQLITRPEPVQYAVISLSKEERAATQQNFAKARKALSESLVWKNDTHSFFASLRTLWNSRLKRLVFFDLSTKEWYTDAESFGRQLRTSLRSAFTRIRIEFYSYVEDFFFTYVENANHILRLTEADLPNSPFQRIFNATRMFLVEQVRRGLFEGLGKVVEFFTCFGNYKHTCRITKRIAKKYPVIGFHLVVGDTSTPRAPEFSNLVAMLRSLFDEFLQKLKELPRIEYVLMPTLNFKREPIQFVTEAEVACYRSSLMEVCEEAEIRIDTVSSLYTNYSTLPCKDASIAERGDSKEIKEHLAHLREKFHNVACTTTDTVFCGRFAIRCNGIKRHYVDKWESFLLKFYEELHKAAMNVIDKAEERCNRAQQVLHQTPTTVADLEIYLAECAAAQTLSETLKVKECQDIIQRICCMEEGEVPIENNLYLAAERLMKWPEILQQDLAAAELIKDKCRPVLKNQVESLRRETRDHITALSTGVIELYNQLNLEMCDVAAATCVALRDLVDYILETINKILHQEQALGLPPGDTFEDLYPLLNHFDIIEQFWITVDKSSTLREYYASPVTSLNMKIIESVREWRRLIHCSTRNLRAFPPLVRLGQQQEAALASFEGLEEFVSLVTAPGLRKNHWKEIARLVASKLQDDVIFVTDMSISLQRLLDAGILSHMADLTRIVFQARSDFEVESVLEQMKSSAKKIHFQVETVNTSEISTRNRVTEECHTAVLAQVESYILTCRNLRWKTGLSTPIMRALNEWEAATEKTKDTLLEWRKIEAQWAPLHNYLLTVQKAQKKERKVNLVPIYERLLRAHDAFHQLHLKIGKPQFSLYMAIVQETVMEHLTAAKTALGELTPLLGEVFEKKREAFPRFNFVSDKQLITFLSAYNIAELKRLLPHMYARLTDVEVKHNCIVSFTTADGSTIKANPVVPLKDSLNCEWICEFDQTLSRSVFSATKECYLDFGKGALEGWIDEHCPQMLVMAFKAVHTKRMRQLLSFSGLPGLQGYRTHLKNVKEELCRLCEKEKSGKKRDKMGQVLSSLFNAELDVSTALGKKISNTTELDGTTMIQTFIEGKESKTKILGVDFTNGTEFYGALESSVVMTPEIVERLIILIVLTLMGKATPMVCGPKRRFLPFIIVSSIGRFFIPIQCFFMMKKETISAFLRGAIQIGAVLCFHDTEKLEMEVRAHLHDMVKHVTTALNSMGRKERISLTLPLGPGGTVTSIPVSREFHVMFTCKEFDKLPRNISIESRPIQMPHVDPSAIIRGYLYTFGYPDETASSLQFGRMYQLFHRIRPTHFTMRALMMIVRMAAERDRNVEMIERLCDSFVKFYYSVLKVDNTMQKLFFHCVRYVLCLNNATCQSFVEKLCEVERPNTYQVFSRFTDLITSSRRVIISGAAFSGKTKVWKRWVGSASYFIFSPALTSVVDLFGSPNQPGVFATMDVKTNLSVGSNVIVEGGAYLRHAFWTGIEDFSRILVGEQACIVGNSSLIITTRRLHQMDPGVLSMFSHFHMEITYTWQRFLRNCLSGAPHAELAIDVMEIVLDSIFQSIREETHSYISASYHEDEHLLAVTLKCANLYRKWYEHSKFNFKLCSGDEEFTIDERAFVAQCGILAACWGTGLALPTQDRIAIDNALLNCDGRLGDLMESYDVTERLLPPLKGTSLNIFDMVSTPCGWKNHRDATNVGFTYPWSTHSNLNPQQPAWFQVFQTSSRLNIIKAAECLIECGENVVFCGSSSSGKSTLLRSTRFCDRWLPRVIPCSQGINPTSIQESICARLTRRSNNCYGPQIGRKLVVCIDDIHLTPLLEQGLPMAAQIIAFCTKFNAITTPKDGFLPVQDVVFCASMDNQKLHCTVSRGCVEIFLPHLDGDELAAGLWELFEACCAKKRVELFPRQAAAFITIAHSYYVRVATHLELPEKSAYISGYDGLLRQALELFPERFRDALRASDIIRTNLLTSIPDIQVVNNSFKYVDEFYTAKLLAEAPEGVSKFRENLVHVAEVTLGICAQDVVFQDLVNREELLFDSASQPIFDTVCSWISLMENSVHLMKINLLESVMKKGQDSTYIAPENSSPSIFISYPSLMSSGSKVVLTPQQPRKSSARIRSARHGGPVAPGVVGMSHTYPTTWLVTHANFLAKALKNEDMHFVFTSSETFGCKRLLRLVCCAVCMPLALFRDKQEGYNFDVFKNELKGSISYALLNDTGVVLYIPYSILQMDRVAWLIDTIIQTGEISELYTGEEMTALAKGYHLTQRSLRQLTMMEALELRRRVQHCLHFVLHVDSPSTLKFYGAGYPSMNQLFAITLHTPSSDAALRLELAQGILKEKESHEKDVDMDDFERKFGSNDEVARLICLIYDEVSTVLPTKGEQLIEFTQLVRKFRHTMIQRIQHNAHMANVVSNHGNGENDESDISQQLRNNAEKLVETQNTILELSQRYKMEEIERSQCLETAEAAKARLSEEQDAITDHEQLYEEVESRLKRALHATAHALKKAKTQNIRNLSQSRAPDKGSQLVRAVFRILGEEVKYNSRTELWNQGMKVMCKNTFPETFSAIRPDDISDPQGLLSMQQELSEVRFVGSLAYGQTIADFILSLMALLKHRSEGMDTKLKSKKEASQSNLHLLLSKAEMARFIAEQTAESIRSLEKFCDEIRESQTMLEEREMMLSRFVTLVDKFAEFVVAIDSRAIECVEGDIILVAAIFSLLIMHRDMETIYQHLQRVLLERGIRTTLRWENAVKHLLFPGQSRQVDSFVPNGLPRRHRMVLYMLMARAHLRWPLIGGVCDIFEESLREYLSFECTGCVVVSAFDPNARSEFLSALKDGCGLIVRDVVDASTVNLIRPLGIVLQRINEMRMQNSTEKKFTVIVYGKEMEVDVRFFLVCVSTPLVPCDKSSPLSQWFHIVNLHAQLLRPYRYERLLHRAPTIKNLPEDIMNKRQLLYDEIFYFIRAYDTATYLISADFAKEDSGKLKQLQDVIEELTLHYGLITQYVNQLQAMTKQQRDAWIPVEGAVKRVSLILRFIEFNKMERPWNDMVLDDYVRNMCLLPPHLVARIAPQIYSEISMPEKHFYAIMNFLESVLRGFNNGWPHTFRSIFALLLVGGVTANSEEIIMQRGYLYPSKLEMLNSEQIDVLKAILSDNTLKMYSAEKDEEDSHKKIEDTIREIYLMSEDPLLAAVAADKISAEENLVEVFFVSLLDFHLERAGRCAEQMVNGFFAAVRESRSVASESGRGRDEDTQSNPDSHISLPAHVVPPPLRQIRSEQDLFVQSVQLCVPICIGTNYDDSGLILRRLPNYSQIVQLHYRWFHVSSGADLKPIPRLILQSFYESHPDTKGNCIVVHLDLPEKLLQPFADLTDSQKEELKELVEELARTMYAYNGRRNAPNYNGKNIKVCFIIVVSKTAHNVLWGEYPNEGHSSLLRCLYFCRVFVTPQRHLLDLLSTLPSLSRKNWERKNRGSASPQAGGRTITSGRGFDLMGDFRLSLESMAQLMAKELMIIHVAMAQRIRMTQFNWRITHGKPYPKNNERQLMNDENLTLMLQLLKGWMQWTDVLLQEKEITTTAISSPDDNGMRLEGGHMKSPIPGHRFRVHTSLKDATAHADPKLDIQTQVSNIFGMPDGRERHAYLFYRNQLRAWGREKAQQSLISCGIASPISTGSHGPFDAEFASPSVTEDSAETLESQLSFNIFNTFQKFAYEVLSCYGVSRGEANSLQWLLRKVVVVPSNSAVVSCHFTDLQPRCPLLLDADTDFKDFELEVAEIPSDLIELCGDGRGTKLYRQSIAQQSRKLFFSFTKNGHGPDEGIPTVSQGVARDLGAHHGVVARANSSVPVNTRQEKGGVHRAQSSQVERHDSANMWDGSAGLRQMSSGHYNNRPSSAGISLQPQATEWRHDFDGLRQFRSSKSLTGEMLSKADLVSHDDLRASHSAWLKPVPSDPVPHGQSASDILPWMLEEEHAMSLLQFYSSAKSVRPDWERQYLVATYRYLSTKAFAKETSISVWLPALEKPSVTLELVCAAVHQKLMNMVDEDELERRAEWLETRVHDTVLIVTQRRLLSVGDVILLRAHLSESLQKNIQKLTEWEDGHFRSSESEDVGIDEEKISSEDVVVAVRMMEVKSPPPMHTITMLEAPINRSTRSKIWEKPREVVVKSNSEFDARAFTWSVPAGNPFTGAGHGGLNGRRESRTLDRRLSTVPIISGPTPMFFTSLDLSFKRGVRERCTYHMLSGTPVDIFYESLTLGKFKKDDIKMSGDPIKSTMSSPDLLSTPRSLLDEFTAAESDEDYAFAIQKTWKSIIPRPLCLIWQKNDEMHTTSLDIPREGMVEYYIYIK